MLLADAGHCGQLQGEGSGVLEVSEAPAEPDHGVLLDRLVAVAAGQLPELVRAEVHGAVEHGTRGERTGDRGELGRHALDELVALTGIDQLARVAPLQRLGDQELSAQQPDAVDGQSRDLRRPIGDRQVDLHPVASVIGA